MGPSFSLLFISCTHTDVLTIDGPETRNTSCKQNKDFGLSYRIFQSNIRRNMPGFFLHKKCVQWAEKRAKYNYYTLW